MAIDTGLFASEAFCVTPSLRAVMITRQAISPRFAIRSFPMLFATECVSRKDVCTGTSRSDEATMRASVQRASRSRRAMNDFRRSAEIIFNMIHGVTLGDLLNVFQVALFHFVHSSDQLASARASLETYVCLHLQTAFIFCAAQDVTKPPCDSLKCSEWKFFVRYRRNDRTGCASSSDTSTAESSLNSRVGMPFQAGLADQAQSLSQAVRRASLHAIACGLFFVT